LDGKEKASSRSQKLPKSSRLKKKSDFKFASFKRVKTKHFLLVIALNGKGRLGVSLSKRILKTSVARNRVRRLLREAFRQNPESFQGLDVNVLGLGPLTSASKTLNYLEVEREILKALSSMKGREIDNEQDF